MELCILCNEPLIEKAFYESNKDSFAKTPKFKHKEHIIQNAIGGRLKSDNILCEECGGILNDEIDAEFLKLFTGFTERLKDRLPKERNKNSKTPVKGYQVNTRREVVFLNNEITPKKPEFEINEEEKTIKIYANKVVLKNFKSHVTNILKKDGKNIEDYVLDEITQFEDNDNIGLFFSEGVENF
ncbi:MAG: HNH endonuclease, partial [Bacteroidales bacterium]|nr:HNH endonuclease [Bacteroidales bacterium]